MANLNISANSSKLFLSKWIRYFILLSPNSFNSIFKRVHYSNWFLKLHIEFNFWIRHFFTLFNIYYFRRNYAKLITINMPHTYRQHISPWCLCCELCEHILHIALVLDFKQVNDGLAVLCRIAVLKHFRKFQGKRLLEHFFKNFR